MNILVIAPHPDDEVLGCGGTMAAHASAGDDVTVVLLTRGHPSIFSDESVALTRREMARAHHLLGVKEQVFCDFPAPGLETVGTHAIADHLAKVVRKVKPEVVYIPFGGDLHLDHKAAYTAALVASRPINNCTVKRILCYETLSETEWGDTLTQNSFVPNVFHDIHPYLERKLEAMACFETQLRAAPHPRHLGAIRSLAGYRGVACGMHAAEAFSLVREAVSFPPQRAAAGESN